MKNTNCFAYLLNDCGIETCTALDVEECSKNCSFFKTVEQMQKDNEKAFNHNLKLGLINDDGERKAIACKNRYNFLKAKFESEGTI